MEQTAEKIIKRAVKLGAEASVLINSSSTLCLEYAKDELSNTSDGENASLQIRVSKGKKFGYSTTNNFQNWENCLSAALKAMKVSKPLNHRIQLAGKFKFRKPAGLYSKSVAEMPMKKMFEKAEQAMDTVRDISRKITVPGARFSKSETKAFFMNSNKVRCSEKSTLLSAMVECGIGTSSGTEGKDSHSDFDFVPTARDAARMCIDSQNPRKVHTMKTDLILDYFAAADLIESALVPSVLAENVQNNKSFLKGKIGRKVFSDKLSITDNGTLEKGLFSGACDIEGSRTRKTEIFSKGILKNFLYDIYSADTDKKKTTGNCSSLAKFPSVGITNLVVSPGEFSRDEILEETKQGIIAKFVMGTHFVNPVTGDASVGINEAFAVEKGCLAYPVKQAMIFVNIFDALKKINVIGNNMRQDSSVACPTIKLEGVQVIS